MVFASEPSEESYLILRLKFSTMKRRNISNPNHYILQSISVTFLSEWDILQDSMQMRGIPWKISKIISTTNALKLTFFLHIDTVRSPNPLVLATEEFLIRKF